MRHAVTRRSRGEAARVANDPADRSDTAAVWSGSARLVPGMLTFTGRFGCTAAHAHAAVQLLIVSSGTIMLRDQLGRRQQVRAAIIPPGAVHKIEVAENAFGTTYFLEPASRAATLTTARVFDAGDSGHVSTWTAAASHLGSSLDTFGEQCLRHSRYPGQMLRTDRGLRPWGECASPGAADGWSQK